VLRNFLRPAVDEWIIFSLSGRRPFEDYIHVIPVGGGTFKPILEPGHDRSFLTASGNSLGQELVVTVHARVGDGAEDHLYLYEPTARRWRRLLELAGTDGGGTLSPDGTKVAFIHATDNGDRFPRLWLLDLSSGLLDRLAIPEEGWDAEPRWIPSGAAIGYIHLRRGDRGLLSSLRLVELNHRAHKELLGAEEGAGAFCFSPDGSEVLVWTRNGLEAVGLQKDERRVIMPAGALPELRIRSGSLDWSRRSRKIAFAIYNVNKRQDEIWTISEDGSNAQTIFRIPDASITRLCFIQP